MMVRRVDPPGQQQRRGRVPEVVIPDVRQPGRALDRLEKALCTPALVDSPSQYRLGAPYDNAP